MENGIDQAKAAMIITDDVSEIRQNSYPHGGNCAWIRKLFHKNTRIQFFLILCDSGEYVSI